MNILFVHQNFPGQFTHLAAGLAKIPGNKVIALAMYNHTPPTGVTVRHYSLLRNPVADTHPLLVEQESHIMRAEACAAAMLQLKREGFQPDLIVAHPGWGEALFAKDVFPRAKLAIYCEFYYGAEGRDVGFDPDQPPLTFAQQCKLRLKNSTNLLSLEIADAGISPTLWQKSTFPIWAQEKITVIHEGVDLQRLQYNPLASLRLKTEASNRSIELHSGTEVLTYVARNLEPVRGFHVFMRTLPEVLRQRPNAQVVIVGGNDVSYGMRPTHGLGWKELMLQELGASLDLNRVHFTGQVPYEVYLKLLSISRLHTYWTVPFVLSWSFIEAACSGLPVIASDTPPVQEFADQLQVQKIDFFDNKAYAEAIVQGLTNPRRNKFGANIDHLDFRQCIKRQHEWLASIF